MLIQTLLEQPIVFLLWVVAIVVALSWHEFAHGITAKWLGDPTAEHQGRLTLNPLAHIDWMGFILLVIAGFGWAKPTPFNPYNLKYKKWGSALVSIAGPISNMIIVLVIGTILAVLHRTVGVDPENLMVLFFLLVLQINVLLAVFNLIPIPPLDGSKILYTFIIDRRPDIVANLERYGMWILLALVFLGGNILGTIYNFFYGLVLQVIF